MNFHNFICLFKVVTPNLHSLIKRGLNNLKVLKHWLDVIIHPIHRLKLFNWLNEGHMTSIIFDNVHVWKITHVCYFLLFP